MNLNFSIVGMLGAVAAAGQTITVAGAGYLAPAPIPVAPGQVITLFVDGIGGALKEPARASGSAWPTTLAGVSATIVRSGTAVPIYEVRPISTCSIPPPGSVNTCGTVTALTVQIPFDLAPYCPRCGRPTVPTQLLVNSNNQPATLIELEPLADRVHILTSCDVLISGGDKPADTTGLPCPAIVTHGDGGLVSAARPASAGEELVAYASGLGQTDPAGTTGQAAAAASPTVTAFLLDFNFRPNALATKPTPLPSPQANPVSRVPVPVFTGLTPGFVGLYQINFVVPAIPAGTPACVDSGQVAGGTDFVPVQSNLTVSAGSAFSFDGVGICVAAGN